jgi:1-acyl-sn-glycerol-3-phosphate acyltransferase
LGNANELGKYVAVAEGKSTEELENAFLRKCWEVRVDIALNNKNSSGRKKSSKVVMVKGILMTLFNFFFVYFVTFFGSAFRILERNLLRPVLNVNSRYFPTTYIVKGFMQMMSVCSGAKVERSGVQNFAKDSNGNVLPSLILFSHASNLDSFIVSGACPLPLQFVGKKELFKVPLIGWLFYVYGMFGIDRKNIEQAKKQYEEAAKEIAREKTSIAISPEGTRSKTGLLSEFKKGLFHLAKSAKIRITPTILLGAYELWPPGQMFTTPGQVEVRFLPQIEVSENDDHNSILRKVRRSMLKGFLLEEEHKYLRSKHKSPTSSFLYCSIPLSLLVWFFILKFYNFL